ncbi:hypothetical protein A5N15_08465 [Rothia kristinae]|uniref:Uncharacterized protein n=1 Tax=Rothia kristinae TaxID=37923 RepID=A0A657IUF1_9MICC|nr:hypothetical protein A5N15_08465 [Rothia kristinae]
MRLVSMTAEKSSSFIRSRRVSRVIPALATRTSTGPNSASISEKARSTEAASVTSACTAKKPSGASPER